MAYAVVLNSEKSSVCQHLKNILKSCSSSTFEASSLWILAHHTENISIGCERAAVVGSESRPNKFAYLWTALNHVNHGCVTHSGGVRHFMSSASLDIDTLATQSRKAWSNPSPRCVKMLCRSGRCIPLTTEGRLFFG